jgi:hypothetical protein
MSAGAGNAARHNTSNRDEFALSTFKMGKEAANDGLNSKSRISLRCCSG